MEKQHVLQELRLVFILGRDLPVLRAYNPTTGWEDFWTSGGKTKNKENKEKGPPMTDGRIGRAVFWMLELFLMLCFGTVNK